MVRSAKRMRHGVQRLPAGRQDTGQGVRGFTLLELLVVLVVVGILAAMALPKYSATLERSRQAEANSILGAMRGAQLRWAAEHSGVYTATLSDLDIELPDYNGNGTPGDGKFFDYTTAASGVSTATRNNTQRTAGSPGYELQININGVISCVVPGTCAGVP